MSKRVTSAELERLRAKGARLRLTKAPQPAEDTKVTEEAPSAPQPREEIRVRAEGIETLVLEEQRTRAELVQSIRAISKPADAVMRWRFTVTERDERGNIRVIEAHAES